MNLALIQDAVLIVFKFLLRSQVSFPLDHYGVTMQSKERCLREPPEKQSFGPAILPQCKNIVLKEIKRTDLKAHTYPSANLPDIKLWDPEKHG